MTELWGWGGAWCVAGDYLGGEAYWAGGLHLYTPLPFRPGKGGFGDLFRTHFFLNAGNLCNLNYGERRDPTVHPDAPEHMAVRRRGSGRAEHVSA